MTLSRSIAWLVSLAVVAGATAIVVSGRRQPPAPTPAESIARDADRSPRRIVVANTAVLDAVTALVSPDRVAAICRQAFTWSQIARRPQAWTDCPSFPAFTAESVLAHDPDLVLCSPHSLPETVAALRALDVPLVAIPFAENLDEVRENLRLVARAVGAEARADELERQLDARVERLRTNAGARESVRALFYTWSGNEGWSSGDGTLQHVALELAGLRNAAAEAGHHGHVRLTFEQLLAIEPDVFVVPATFGEAVDATAEQLRTDAALRELRAVRADRMIELHPSLFSTSSHEIVTAAEHIAAAVDALPAAPATGATGSPR